MHNGTVDDEIGLRIGRLQAKGAFVWLVADTCNAGTIARGAPPAAVHYRGITPGRLGISAPTTDPGAARVAWQTAAFEVEIPAVGPTRGDAGTPPPGSHVAFYAARAGEPAPELPLPDDSDNPRWHGLLSRRLAEALEADNMAAHTGGQLSATRRADSPALCGATLTDAVVRWSRIGCAGVGRQWTGYPVHGTPVARA